MPASISGAASQTWVRLRSASEPIIQNTISTDANGFCDRLRASEISAVAMAETARPARIERDRPAVDAGQRHHRQHGDGSADQSADRQCQGEGLRQAQVDRQHRAQRRAARHADQARLGQRIAQVALQRRAARARAPRRPARPAPRAAGESPRRSARRPRRRAGAEPKPKPDGPTASESRNATTAAAASAPSRTGGSTVSAGDAGRRLIACARPSSLAARLCQPRHRLGDDAACRTATAARAARARRAAGAAAAGPDGADCRRRRCDTRRPRSTARCRSGGVATSSSSGTCPPRVRRYSAAMLRKPAAASTASARLPAPETEPPTW